MKSQSPQFPMIRGWDPIKTFLKNEAQQSIKEGRDPISVQQIASQADLLDDSEDAKLAAIWYALQELPIRNDFPFVEPSDLESIQAERNQSAPIPPLSYGDDALLNRMTGAWLGRCAGCALGKPVEVFLDGKIPMSGREKIKMYLTAISPEEYPLHDYFPGTSPASEQTGRLICEKSTREKIAFMESDDDIRYTVIGQMVLLKHGASFTTTDVAKAWLEYLGYAHVCSAETQAYRNLVIRYRPNFDSIDWDWVATHQNPYREWIGAQIRADSWGYAAPGNPELAAEFAWRDARMTHVKNGIYGEMFCAAMIAAAFALQDPLTVIEAGLAQIPSHSRLYQEILETIEICREHGFRASEFEAVHQKLHNRFGHYHSVHTNNNAALVVSSLLLGHDDFEKAITLAVMGGWDTDCNGATVGSIWGAMYGADRIPKKWTGPLNDTLFSKIPDYDPIAISECARRSVEIAKEIQKSTQSL